MTPQATYEIHETMKITNRAIPTRTQYPFEDLEIGQCLELAVDDSDALRSAAWDWARRHGRKFSVRKISDGLYGVWRIS